MGRDDYDDNKHVMQSGRTRSLVALVVAVALFAAACTEDEKIGLVNGCDHNVEVIAVAGDVRDWVLVTPGDAAYLGIYAEPAKDGRTYPVELRITTETVIVMDSDDLLDGDSGDWDREFLLTDEQCDQLT